MCTVHTAGVIFCFVSTAMWFFACGMWWSVGKWGGKKRCEGVGVGIVMQHAHVWKAARGRRMTQCIATCLSVWQHCQHKLPHTHTCTHVVLYLCRLLRVTLQRPLIPPRGGRGVRSCVTAVEGRVHTTGWCMRGELNGVCVAKGCVCVRL